jgi:hypothetical protein
MTVDVNFGVLDYEIDYGEKYYFVHWDRSDDKIENDGTSEKYTVFSGKPIRCFSSSGFYELIDSNEQFKKFYMKCKPNYPESNDFEFIHITDDLIYEITSFEEKGSNCDIDRIKWFKYWARRAREEYGDKACLGFS